MKFWRAWSWRKRLVTCGVAGFGLVLAFLLGRGAWQRWQLGRAVAAIRAAGEPTTADELSALSRVGGAMPDATPIWRAAFASGEPPQFQRYSETKRLPPGPDVPPRPGEEWAELATVDEFFGRNASAMKNIELAVAAPGACCYLEGFDFSSGDIMLPHVDGLRLIGFLLRQRAHVRAHRGDGAGALADIRGNLRAAETLAREPLMLSSLVRISETQRAVEAIENLLHPNLADDKALARVQRALLAVNFQRGMELAVMGERVWGLHAFEDARAAGAGRTPTVFYRLWIRDDPLEFLSMMQQFLTAVRTEWPEPLRLTEKYAAHSEAAGSLPAPMGKGMWWQPSGRAGQLRHFLIESAANETARLRAAATGVAAMRFRISEGRWPRSLHELTPKWMERLPPDPFTGEPLRSAVGVEGFRVYSVGLNGADDGGVETPEDGAYYRRGKPDVVFRVRDELMKAE
jgi:hypothetical protein